MSMIRVWKRRGRWAPAAMLLLAIGCEPDDIRVYEAPRDPQPITQASAPAATVRMRWFAPPTWREDPTPRTMRLATYLVGEHDPPLEIAVSSFPGDVGGTLGNINRWREQVGQPPLTEAQWPEHVEPFGTPGEGVHGWTIRIDAPADDTGRAPHGMLAAIIQFDGADQTWFVRAMGPTAQLDEHEAAFTAFAAGFEVDDAAASTADAAPANATPQGQDDHGFHAHHHHEDRAADELVWEVPEGWQVEPPRSMITYAAFRVPDPSGGDEAARLTVTPLRGDGGGLLENVNLWRNQLGQPPVEDLQDQPTQTLSVDGREATLLTLDGGRGVSLLVAIVHQAGGEGEEGRTWFFRLTGPTAVVHAQHGSFVRFLSGTHFVEEGR